MEEAEQVTFLPMEAIGERGELDLSRIREKDEVSTGYTLFFENDVVVAKITPCFENGKGALVRGLFNGIGFGTTELHVLTPGPDLDGRYLYYLTVSEPFRKQGEAGMIGAAGQKRVPEEFIRNFRLVVPSIAEQRSITSYIDRETARIDALIAEKGRVLTLLSEKRRALITRAVTRGVDDSAPIRDSGIPWLGMIPAHWKVERLKFHLGNIEQGWSPQCDNFPANEDEWGVLKVGAVNRWEFNPNENKRLPEDAEPLLEYQIALGDVLISRANTKELLGSVSIVRTIPPKLLLCDKLYRLVFNSVQLDKEFLVLFLRSLAGRYEFERDATGASSSMQNIGQDSVRNVWVPIPPSDEQRVITSYVISE
ncbi:MAG: restriction endonuclease subunit S, partial [Bacteroidota bacterium]